MVTKLCILFPESCRGFLFFLVYRFVNCSYCLIRDKFSISVLELALQCRILELTAASPLICVITTPCVFCAPPPLQQPCDVLSIVSCITHVLGPC
jgi:hypothetical protein